MASPAASPAPRRSAPSPRPSRARELVDAVVACHDPARPLARCVGSILSEREGLREAGADLLVTVVAHNRSVAEITGALTPGQQEEIARGGIRVLHLADGIFSPAGPITLGIQESPGTWVSTIGSDDALEPGALVAWLRRGRAVQADAVIAPVRLPDGAVVRTPYLRPRRRDVLDPLRDHLAYRTAPLGLLRTATLERIGFAYTRAHLANGSDIEPGLRLWFRGGRITYPYGPRGTGTPGYAVSAEMGSGRVTSTLGRAARELGWLPPLLAQDWLRTARDAERDEIATKVVRAHMVPVIQRRALLAATAPEEDLVQLWTAADAQSLGELHGAVLDLAGGPLRGLSIAESAVIRDAARAADAPALAAAWSAHRAGSGLRRALPPRLRDAARPTARPRLFAEQQLGQRRHLFGRDRDGADPRA